jgi:hypothetical protein
MLGFFRPGDESDARQAESATGEPTARSKAGRTVSYVWVPGLATNSSATWVST